MSGGGRTATGSGPTDRAVGTRALDLGLAATGLLFLVAVRLLGVATDAASPELSQLHPRVVRSNAAG